MAGRRNAKAKACRNSLKEHAEIKCAQITAQTQENVLRGLEGSGGRCERTAVGAQPPLATVRNPNEGGR
jgi:hypothetical protein